MHYPHISSNFFVLTLIKRIKNAIITAKRPTASVKPKPSMAVLNKSSFNIGFLDISDIRDANISPIYLSEPLQGPKESKFVLYYPHVSSNFSVLT